LRDAHSGAAASYGEPITLSLQERLTGVNAAGATYGLGHQLIALVWIAGFSAYFTDEGMARGRGPAYGGARYLQSPRRRLIHHPPRRAPLHDATRTRGPKASGYAISFPALSSFPPSARRLCFLFHR
jgi:hypothetical protein